jgi:hypothetical protein
MIIATQPPTLAPRSVRGRFDGRQRTTEDMSQAWLNFCYPSDGEFKVEVAARKVQKLNLICQR